MFPMDRRFPPVVVSYDCRGKRIEKRFEDAFEARRFYVKQHKAGKNPHITKADK